MENETWITTEAIGSPTDEQLEAVQNRQIETIGVAGWYNGAKKAGIAAYLNGEKKFEYYHPYLLGARWAWANGLYLVIIYRIPAQPTYLFYLAFETVTFSPPSTFKDLPWIYTPNDTIYPRAAIGFAVGDSLKLYSNYSADSFFGEVINSHQEWQHIFDSRWNFAPPSSWVASIAPAGVELFSDGFSIQTKIFSAEEILGNSLDGQILNQQERLRCGMGISPLLYPAELVGENYDPSPMSCNNLIYALFSRVYINYPSYLVGVAGHNPVGPRLPDFPNCPQRDRSFSFKEIAIPLWFDAPDRCDIPITIDPQYRDTGYFCMSFEEYNQLMTRFPNLRNQISTTNDLLRGFQ